MPAPNNILEFVELVGRSNLVERRQLDAYLNRLAAEPEQPTTPKMLAQAMIRDGILTILQAGLLLRGKWKNFIISGKYKLLEHLGTGGMGSVYLCEHILMRRRVALKVLPADRVSDPVILERFYREARAVAVLDHRNIVRAYDIDRDGDMHFLVLEYVDGSPLSQIVEKFGPLPIDRAVNFVTQAADGLQHAHEAGLVHRDIKPGNLLLDRLGTIKILDLGLARFFDDDGGQITRKFEVNSVLGTADYVAPEQAIDSSNVDIRSDIYSLGVTFYYLLTGRNPYKDGSVSQKLMWHQISAPTPITEYRSDVPRRLAAVIDCMLQKDPNNRFQEPAEVIEALAEWDEGPTIPPDHEMPQLCAAAMSSYSTGRLPQLRPSAQGLARREAAVAPATPSRWQRMMNHPQAKTIATLVMVAVAALGGAAAAVLAAQ